MMIKKHKMRWNKKMKNSWKESKGGRGLCFSKDLNRLLLMIITITKGDNNDRRC